VTRTTASSKQKKGGKGSRGAGASAILPTDQPSLQELVDIRASNEEMYGQPERTRNTYKGYIKNGKEFLAKLIEKRQREDITAEDKLVMPKFGSNLNLPEPDLGSVQSSKILPNWTLGPVRCSHYQGWGRTCPNPVRTEPFGPRL